MAKKLRANPRNFKTEKMSENKFPQPDFSEEMVFDPAAKHEITGRQLDMLYTFFNAFTPGINIVNALVTKGMASGKIRVDYQYADGSPVPDEVVEAYQEKVKRYFASIQPGQTISEEVPLPESNLIIPATK